MRSNPLVPIPPSATFDSLEQWALKSISKWLPCAGSDLCDRFPCVYLQREQVVGRVGQDDPPEEYYEIGIDPEWEGETIGERTVRAKHKTLGWQEVDIELRVDYEWEDWILFADAEQTKSGGVVRLVWNFFKDDALCHKYRRFDAEASREIRAIFVHEMTHILDPTKQMAMPLPDPKELLLPWDKKQWEEDYVQDSRERMAFARELVERMKDLWLYGYGHDDYANGAMFPADLMQMAATENPVLKLYMGKLPSHLRKVLMGDVRRAFKLFIRSHIRRGTRG